MIVSRARARSTAGRLVQTCGAVTRRMACPPGDGASLEEGNQLFNAGGGQDGRLGAGLGREVRAADRDVAVLSGEELDLAVADMAGQPSDAGQLQRAAEERVSGVGDRDVAFAFLCDQRGITVAEVWRTRRLQARRQGWEVGQRHGRDGSLRPVKRQRK
jgi:hypothetical protein